MAEPEKLKRGKEFQRIVQKDFENNTRNGKVYSESFVSLKDLKKYGNKSGRMDIFIEELGDFVTIVEIKATDWDKIKPANIKKNLWRHQRQLYKYIEKFLDVNKTQVCPGIIYPHPPKDKGLKKLIEEYLTDYGAPPYWYNDIKS